MACQVNDAIKPDHNANDLRHFRHSRRCWIRGTSHKQQNGDDSKPKFLFPESATSCGASLVFVHLIYSLFCLFVYLFTLTSTT